MNEAETRAEHTDPAVKAADWGVVEGSRVLREHGITLGRLQPGAVGASQGRRARAEIADYALVYRNTKLAVVEAKAWAQPHAEGVAQAKSYAAKLAVRFTYSTNGQAIYGVDKATGAEGDVPGFPSSEALWAQTFAQAEAAAAAWRGVNVWPPSRSRTRAVPGKGATTRRSPLPACSRPSTLGAIASCSRWPPARARPS